MARLAALAPRPKANQTRFHGVFVRGGHKPNSKHQALVMPPQRVGEQNEEYSADHCVYQILRSSSQCMFGMNLSRNVLRQGFSLI